MRQARSQKGEQRREVSAEIRWLTPLEGGRKNLPAARTYRSVPRFDEDPNGVRGVWDINVEFVDMPTSTRPSMARIYFLSEKAPADLLHSGSRFHLTEGRKVVARGQVCDDVVPKGRSSKAR